MSAGNSSGGSAGPRPHLTIRAVALRYVVTVRTVRGWLQRDPAFPRPASRGRQGQYLWNVADLEAYDAARAKREGGGGAG
jgi:hypothetical protein